MANDFLGRGWKFPVGVDATGKIALSEYEVDVREAIQVILGTCVGERVMRPTFGGGLHDYVFESMSVTVLGRIQATVFASLVANEQRIQVLNVNVSQSAGDPGTLLIGVDYKVRASNTKFNLVFPFYLQQQN
ncbi:MAG: GPW/gp25 family protein [Candidatus Korobacteraceae bacterium]